MVLQKCCYFLLRYPRWPPGTLIGWDIFDFFSRTIAWTVTKLAINVPLMVLQKCCYFCCDRKSKMAALDSDWLRHFRLLNHCMDVLAIKCSSNCPAEVFVTFCCDRKSKMAAMDSDWLRHFRLLLKNHCMYWHQTFHKWSSSGPEEVLLLFVAIGFPRWPPWTLIGWDIFDFFSRTTAGTITKLAINVPFIALQKCRYFLLRWKIPRWLPWTLIGWDIFNFFSRTTAWMITKLATNVPFMVPRKCCYFSLRSEIQDGCHGLWLAETIFDFFSRITTWMITKFATNVPLVVLKKCCHFSLRSKIPRWSPWTLIGWDIFDFFSRTTAWMITIWTYHNCSSSSPEEVLLLFLAIGNQDGRNGLRLA